MGYQAWAVFECIPYFKQVLDETPLNNLLVHACRIYLEDDFVIAGLKVLANFTYEITMPYLNCVERSDQNTLVEILTLVASTQFVLYCGLLDLCGTPTPHKSTKNKLVALFEMNCKAIQHLIKF